MSWTIFKVNVLKSMITGQFSKDPDSFAEFYANEYDQCIKRGGDMIYGVPIINGNVKGMADVIKRALKKGTDSDGENFNILQEIYPSAFDAYWLGAEMAPIPNPLLKPIGWQMTPPAPGTIMNIGPSPIPLAISTAKHKAEVEALKALEDALKSKTIEITLPAPAPSLIVNVYETIQKIQNKEELAPEVKNHPAILAGKEIVAKLKQAKKKKPSIGSQFKPSIKLTFVYELFLRLTYNSVKIMSIPRLGYKHINLRQGSIFWNYKNGDTTLSENEVKFWINSAKKEYFFVEDRNIKYEPETV